MARRNNMNISAVSASQPHALLHIGQAHNEFKTMSLFHTDFAWQLFFLL